VEGAAEEVEGAAEEVEGSAEEAEGAAEGAKFPWEVPLAPQQVAQIRYKLPATLPRRPHVLHALPAVLLQEALHTRGCTKELLALAGTSGN
jgi:hypothetical protein